MRSPEEASARGRRLLVGVVAGYLLSLVGLWLGVSRCAALRPTPGAPLLSAGGWPGPLDAVAAGRALAALRAELEGRMTGTVELGRWRGRAGLWCAGRRVGVAPVDSDGKRLSAPGLLEAAAQLDGAARAACRLRLDVEIGRAPLITAAAPLLAVSLVPGIDGLGLDLAGRELVLDADELVTADLLGHERPLRGVDFELGLDVPAALRHLALAAGVDAEAWRAQPRRFFRLRSQSWVEGPGGAAIALLRGFPPAPPVTVGLLRAAARRGAAYLERHLSPAGRFDYVYDAVADQTVPDGDHYSLPRHAGATWYLSQAAAGLDEPRFATAAARALDSLAAQAPAGCQRRDSACVGYHDAQSVDLGSSALALLAAVEYRRASGDARFDPWARRLAAFIMRMQSDSGDFRHLYDPASGVIDEHARLLYYSGEATLALSRLAADPGSDASMRADLRARVERSLDWLTGQKYGSFVGGFFFGEEHWTCLALDDAWEHLPVGPARERYADFCEGFAAYLGRTRVGSDNAALAEQPDLLGSYGFTALAPAHPTPVASRTEAVISAWRVARARGRQRVADEMAAGVRQSLGFLLSRQIGPAVDWKMPSPGAADGGFAMSDVRAQVRIDSVQHAGSAMLRASVWAPLSAEEGSPGGN